MYTYIYVMKYICVVKKSKSCAADGGVVAPLMAALLRR
jgi:hypothetical protein